MKLQFFNTKKYFNSRDKESHCKMKVVLLNYERFQMIPFGISQKMFSKYNYMRLDGKGLYFNVEGVSRCHPHDKVDEELGIHIAESRAKLNAYSKAYRVIEYIMKEMYLFLEGDGTENICTSSEKNSNLEDYGKYIYDLGAAEDEHISLLID